MDSVGEVEDVVVEEVLVEVVVMDLVEAEVGVLVDLEEINSQMLGPL